MVFRILIGKVKSCNQPHYRVMLHRIHILNNNHEKTFSPERTNIAKPSHDALKKTTNTLNRPPQVPGRWRGSIAKENRPKEIKKTETLIWQKKSTSSRPWCLPTRRAWRVHQAGSTGQRSGSPATRLWTSCCKQRASMPQMQHARKCLKYN